MSRPAPRIRLVVAATAVAAGLALTLVPAAGAAGAPAPRPAAAGVVAAGVAAAPAPPAAERRARAERAHDRLDRRSRQAPADVAGWYVDDASGQTVVSVVGGGSPAAAAFVADPDPAVVRVETGAPVPRPLVASAAARPLVDGQALYGAGIRCSIGFSVRSGARAGVLTAGHCTDGSRRWYGPDGTALGTTSRSAWPRDDYGSLTVSNVRAWTPTARIQGGPVVRGAVAAPIGAMVCRSGSTTGYQCGQITSREQTVNYGGGDVVSGLTRTTACAESGDSGGPFVEQATGQAQGLTSGGTGDCATGGVTFFQPIGEVLAALRVTLVTG